MVARAHSPMASWDSGISGLLARTVSLRSPIPSRGQRRQPRPSRTAWRPSFDTRSHHPVRAMVRPSSCHPQSTISIHPGAVVARALTRWSLSCIRLNRANGGRGRERTRWERKGRHEGEALPTCLLGSRPDDDPLSARARGPPLDRAFGPETVRSFLL